MTAIIGAIISAVITGGLSLVGVIITSNAAAHKTEMALKVNQAVTDTKLESLTAEVRKHNDFATRVPLLEEKVKDLSHRITKLEEK